MEFNQNAIESIGHYVYALVDPRDGSIFYIGEGQGNRVFAHRADGPVGGKLLEADSRESRIVLSEKIARIKEINEAGHSVERMIIRHALPSEETALVVEAALIDLCRLMQIPLANLQGGHGSSDFGLMSFEDVNARYDAPEIASFPRRTIIINIGRKYERRDSRERIYEHTRFAWRLNGKSANATDLVVATAQGLVRGVFKNAKWRPVAEDTSRGSRWEFDGEIDAENWSILVGKRVPRAAVGAANPIKYADYPMDDGSGFQLRPSRKKTAQ